MNEYLREIAGPRLLGQGLPHLGRHASWRPRCSGRSARRIPRTESARRVNIIIRVVAHELGNTPSVCRSCYVHPLVLERYAEGTLPEARLEAPSEREGLREAEATLLELLEDARS